MYLEQSAIAEDVYKRILLERKVEEQLGKFIQLNKTVQIINILKFRQRTPARKCFTFTIIMKLHYHHIIEKI